MILLIDNYDSFVFNVKQYVEDISGKRVHTVRNDRITIKDIKKKQKNSVIAKCNGEWILLIDAD